jgi:lysine 6-dehydrogenase
MGLGAAFDLAHNSADVEKVTLADLDEGRARAVAQTIAHDKIKTARVDVSNYEQVVQLMRGHDGAISCVTYIHNYDLARAAIEARVNFCDLGGNNTIVAQELALDEQARKAQINIIPDCGLAPGMVSVLVAHGAARFEELEAIHIRVGGLPQEPKPPLNYQLTFSVEGLINEYIELARVIRNGEITEVESLTEIESLRFPAPFNKMEAFQTSGGTSTLPQTFAGRVRELDYKTIRYPGHCVQFKLLTDLGLASSEIIEIDGVSTTPRRVLAEMLQRRLPADEPDVVLVRVEFRGVIKRGRSDTNTNNIQTTLRYQIIDRFDEQTRLSAMMRTTSFPASIIAQMMARGEIEERGAIPQESAIPSARFIAELDARNIKIHEEQY